MAAKRTHYLIALVAAFLACGYLAFNAYRDHRLGQLFTRYINCIESADLDCAEQAANGMNWLSRGGSKYYLAHVAVISHIRSRDDQTPLAAALQNMTEYDYSQGPSPWRPLSVEASLTAMQNDRALSLKLTQGACSEVNSVAKDIQACSRTLMLSYALPDGSVWRAVQLYEMAYLHYYLFKDEESLYYKLVALEYLDKSKAIALFHAIRDNDLLNSTRLSEYCHASILSAKENGCIKIEKRGVTN